MTKYELISTCISLISLFSVWITLGIVKFQKLKNDYKQHATAFAKNYNLAPDEVKNAICKNPHSYQLLIDGQVIDDEVLNFSNTWKQFIKCIFKPF